MSGTAAAPLLSVRGLKKTYRRHSGWRHQQPVTALDDINLEVAAGSSLALIGESGSGKTTLALCIAQFEPPDAGEIWFDGICLTSLAARELRRRRQSIQLIFQGSALALNPRFTALEAATEPLDIVRTVAPSQRRTAALDCMLLAGLAPEIAAQPVSTLSGGQKQRLAIARALTVSPSLLIFDESFSGLDLIVQAQILDALVALQATRKLTYVFITHDVSLVAGIADSIAVMQDGRIVERGAMAGVLAQPEHPHTRALLAATPRWQMSNTAEGRA